MSATGNRLKDLATKYIRLGGKRRAVLDDNLVSTREWAEDTAEAKAFWRDEIESLPDPERKDVKEPSDVERNKRPEPPWPFTWNASEFGPVCREPRPNPRLFNHSGERV